MAIEIVATIIPGPAPDAKNGKSKQKFFVYLTPRISYSGIGILQNFRHIYNWPEYFCYFLTRKAKITFYNESHNPIDPIEGMDLDLIGDNYRGRTGEFSEEDILENKVPFRTAPDDKPKNLLRAWKIWRAMFDFDTKVDGWELDKTGFKLLKKLSTEDANAAMNKIIRAEINQLNLKSLRELGIPGIYDTPLEESRIRDGLIDILDHLLTLSPEEKIASPYINNTRSRIPFPGFLQRLQNGLASLERNRERELQDLSLKLSLAEVTERNTTETNEFHKKMAAYGNFPYLLKQTGWILEYELSKEVIRDAKFIAVELAAGSPAVVVPHPPETGKVPSGSGSLCPHCGKTDCDANLNDFETNIHFLYPHTAVEMNDTGDKMITGFRKNNVAGKNQQAFFYLGIKNGYISRQPELYSFAADIIEKNQQFDRIGKYLKQKFDFGLDPAQPAGNLSENESLQQRREGLVGEAEKDLRVLSDEHEQLKEQFMDFNSCGISLRLKQIADLAKMAISTSPNLSGLENIAVVYGHNIHKGYRVDAIKYKDGKPEQQRSLCKRMVYYILKANEDKTVLSKDEPVDKNYFRKFCLVDEDEGWILESMQGSKSQAVYIDEELFRWNDWSLCADPLARGNEYTARKPIESTNIRVHIVPQSNSLLPLRFDEEYNFALRFVDICGNSVAGSNESMENTVLPGPVRYRRLQGVTAPQVILGNALHVKMDRKKDYIDECYGEDLNTLMIRSYYNGRDLEFEPKTETVRYIGPPKLDLNMVKKHKLFDALMQAVAANGDVKDLSKEFLAFTSIPQKYHSHNDEADTREEVMLKNKNVAYLFDPVVNGYAFSVNGKSELSSILIKSRSYLYFRNVWFKQITVTNLASGNDYTFTHQNENDLTFQLQQGVEKYLTVTCKTDQAGLIPSKTNLLLVHAVEKPCLLETNVLGKKFVNKYLARHQEMKLQPRRQDMMDASLTIFFDQFPCLTSEAYILHACYLEKISVRDKFLDDGTLNKDGFQYFQVNRIIKTGVRPDRPDTEQSVWFSGIVHTYNDTKARRVFYSMEAISKFKRFFRTYANDTEDRFSVFGHSDGVADQPRYVLPKMSDAEANAIAAGNINNRGNWTMLDSSAPPPPLKIDSVVPLIKWEGEIGAGKELKRISDTIRVYFDEDWYLSGENEQVAVFFSTEKANCSYNVPKELENVLSQLGNDPSSKKVNNTIPLINEAMLGKNKKDIIDIVFSNLDFEHREKYKAVPGKAALYEVDYMPPGEDHRKGRYFIDIKLNNKELTEEIYFPFIRFAIARYQPDSINVKGADGKGIDIHFSKPVVTDFVQLLPGRKLKCTPDNKLVYTALSERVSDKFPNLVTWRPFAAGSEVMDFADYETGHKTGSPLKTGAMGLEDIDTTKSFIIEEYEQYQSPVVVKDGEPEHSDFRKRLVFSYLYKT